MTVNLANQGDRLRLVGVPKPPGRRRPPCRRPSRPSSPPFAPDTRWAVTVSKEDRGRAGGKRHHQASIRPVGRMWPWTARWALGADAVYFTFAPPRGGRPACRRSPRCPGGYGIYRLALSENQRGAFQARPRQPGPGLPLDPQGAGVLTSPSRRTGRPSSSPPARGGPHLRRGGHRRHDLPPDPLPAPESLYPIHRENGTRQTRPPPTPPSSSPPSS